MARPPHYRWSSKRLDFSRFWSTKSSKASWSAKKRFEKKLYDQRKTKRFLVYGALSTAFLIPRLHQSLLYEAIIFWRGNWATVPTSLFRPFTADASQFLVMLLQKKMFQAGSALLDVYIKSLFSDLNQLQFQEKACFNWATTKYKWNRCFLV